MQPRPFNTFVSREDDLPGLIAYGLYKANKLEFSDTHPGGDISSFMLATSLPTQVEAYRARALIMLQDIADRSLDVAYEAAEQNYLQRLRLFEDSLGFWPGVWANVAANLIAAALYILVVVLAFGAKLNFWNGLFNYLME